MIGYYAHHQGAGHIQRAAAVAAHLGAGMTALSSAVPVPGLDQVRLTPDDDPPVSGDVTAGGALHWAPLRHSGLRSRSNQIARWADERGCSVLVSDVSVEVLLLGRLLSIPTVAVALHGRRGDRAHALGYDVATRIIAPWPLVPRHDWPQRWADKTVWVGAVSRFDGRIPDAGDCARPGRCVVLLLGRGGDSLTEAALAEAAAVSETHWHLFGGTLGVRPIGAHPSATTVERHGWVADPWPVMCRADVVVAAAGDAAIADVAAARRPLIAIPQERPFQEQHDHAEMLVQHGLCLSAGTWPDRDSWPALLDDAQALGGAGWSRYLDGMGSSRMAAEIVDVAHGEAPMCPTDAVLSMPG